MWQGQTESLTHAANLGIFQLIAWAAIGMLLWRAKALRHVTNRDAILMALPTITVFAPDDGAAWVGISFLALLLFVRYRDDLQVRAASMVMFALASQLLWGRLFFELVAFDIEMIDARLASVVLSLMHHAVLVHDNVLQTGTHHIVIYEACTSFHNISIAMLAWVSITLGLRGHWQRSDAFTALCLVLVTIGMNSARLFLMAGSPPDGLDFWHVGLGSQLLNAGLSAQIMALCIWGVRREISA